jgi:DNA polymerase V
MRYFQAKDQLVATSAIVRSSNYELDADLSHRMMDACARFVPEMNIYAIDEAAHAEGNIYLA